MWPDMADSSRTCTHMANTQVMLGYYIQAIHLRPNRAGLSNQLSNQTRLSKQLSNQANNPGTPVESAVKGTNGARLPSCQASKAEATNTTNPGTPFKPAVKGKVTNRTRLPSCQAIKGEDINTTDEEDIEELPECPMKDCTSCLSFSHPLVKRKLDWERK